MTKRLNELFILLDGVLDHGVLELNLMRLKDRFAPCPFCPPGPTRDSSVRIYIQGRYVSLGCDACGARGPRVFLGSNEVWRTIEDAIDQWNRRDGVAHIEKEDTDNGHA